MGVYRILDVVLAIREIGERNWDPVPPAPLPLVCRRPRRHDQAHQIELVLSPKHADYAVPGLFVYETGIVSSRLDQEVLEKPGLYKRIPRQSGAKTPMQAQMMMDCIL